MNQRCPRPERPARPHPLPWRCISVQDRFGMAGSQFLYLPTHYIEPSLLALIAHNMVSRQRELEGETVDVRIVYLCRDRSRAELRCACRVLIRRYREMVDVREICRVRERGVDSLADSRWTKVSGCVESL